MEQAPVDKKRVLLNNNNNFVLQQRLQTQTEQQAN